MEVAEIAALREQVALDPQADQFALFNEPGTRLLAVREPTVEITAVEELYPAVFVGQITLLSLGQLRRPRQMHLPGTIDRDQCVVKQLAVLLAEGPPLRPGGERELVATERGDGSARIGELLLARHLAKTLGEFVGRFVIPRGAIADRRQLSVVRRAFDENGDFVACRRRAQPDGQECPEVATGARRQQ